MQNLFFLIYQNTTLATSKISVENQSSYHKKNAKLPEENISKDEKNTHSLTTTSLQNHNKTLIFYL
jgi:hypothetical protein